MPFTYRFEIWEMTRDESALLDSMIDERQFRVSAKTKFLFQFRFRFLPNRKSKNVSAKAIPVSI